MSLLNDLRSRNSTPDEVTDAYDKAVRECPPVSASLIAYLEKMFSLKYIKPNVPTMQQQLVFQAGQDRIIKHLRSQNERQEQEVRSIRTK
jgi:hypothetical protein